MINVVVQRAGQCCPETGQMSTTITLGNIVGEAVDVFLEGIVPLHGHFHGNSVFTFVGEVENLVQRGLVGVQVLNKGPQTAFILEYFFLATALVRQADTHTTVQERQFPQALGQDVVMEFDVSEGFR